MNPNQMGFIKRGQLGDGAEREDHVKTRRKEPSTCQEEKP